MDDQELVDILAPPMFKKTGQTKTRRQAYNDGDWIATFNLWIVQRTPEPAIVYQQRSPEATWAPGLLDATAGGHLQAGEDVRGGLREVKEELGKTYDFTQLTFLGRKLYVGSNTNGTSKNNIIYIYIVEDDAPLSSYTMQQEEVHALCICPIQELLRAHRDLSYHFSATSSLATGEQQTIEVSKASFPENYDDFHYKMAMLADRYLRGEQNLIY